MHKGFSPKETSINGYINRYFYLNI